MPSAPITPPRYEVPPPPTTKSQPKIKSTPPETSKTGPSTKRSSSTKSSQSASSTARNYTPPSLTKEKTKSRIEEEPPPVVEKQNTPSEPPSKLPGFKPKEEVKSSSTSAVANSGNFLRGKKGSKEGRVISPYPPYRELDVSGLSGGSLALDPTTQKVFEVP